MMTALTKFTIMLTLSLLGENSNEKDFAQTYAPIKSDNPIVKDSTQTRAFEILANKCNVCHVNRNRRRVFTEDNMNDWSNSVYKQVFIKKRMPKGKKIKLTSEEYQNLLTWISSTKNK
ncbi:hypothetical protein D7Z94_05820 [Ulvibacterium marinum]|uniref:Haem-binding domain-containing protein n=2 Tax=Ulvibacterium marinum TaxID=2419782 RepID=A0A3B0CDI8_9FLAO|nr:hypothetical protein D7Z94_05820 [Ulvibacterium marinum]